MKIQIYALGTKMPRWVQEASGEYLKRLPKDFSVEFKELALTTRSKNTSTTQAIEKESEQLLAAIGKNQWVIALDSRGKQWSTEQLAEHAAEWQMSGKSIALLIGGPNGLSQSLIKKADQCWSLSALTLPHPMVRVLLAEQLYRAWSILNNHPYHK